VSAWALFVAVLFGNTILFEAWLLPSREMCENKWDRVQIEALAQKASPLYGECIKLTVPDDV